MARKQRLPKHEEKADESWLLPYADLLTLLLALFIVLFAASSIDSKKFDALMSSFNTVLAGSKGVMDASTIVPLESEMLDIPYEINNRSETTDQNDQSSQFNQELYDKIQQETENLTKLQAEIDQYIQDNGLSTQLTTELNHTQLLLKISDSALFSSGSANIKTEAKELGIAIADMLQDYPQYEIVVSGHTDNVPINTAEFRSNWDLSAKRAVNFMQVLLQNSKLDPMRFSSIAFGEYRPIASNDEASGRSANRRVEISILRNFTDQQEQLIQVQ